MAPNARTKLLHAIQDLILSRGFAGSSVDAICEQAGVSKGSFFHHFKSKDDAASATLQHFFQGVSAMVRESGFMQLTDPVDRLMTYLDGFVSMLHRPEMPQGCLIGSLALEVADSHPQLCEQVNKCFTEWSHGLTALITAAMGQRTDPKPADLADYFIASLEGGLMLAKAKKDMSYAENTIRHFQRYIKQLIVESASRE